MYLPCIGKVGEVAPSARSDTNRCDAYRTTTWMLSGGLGTDGLKQLSFMMRILNPRSKGYGYVVRKQEQNDRQVKYQSLIPIAQPTLAERDDTNSVSAVIRSGSCKEYCMAAHEYKPNNMTSLRQSLETISNYAESIKHTYGMTEPIAQTIRVMSNVDVARLIGNDMLNSAGGKPIGLLQLSDFTDVPPINLGMDVEQARKLMKERLTPSTLNQIIEFARDAVSATTAMRSGLATAVSSIPTPIEARSFISIIPDFTDLLQRLQDAQDGVAALDEAGFAYAYGLFEMEFLPSWILRIGQRRSHPSSTPLSGRKVSKG